MLKECLSLIRIIKKNIMMNEKPSNITGKPKLLDQVWQTARLKHYSYKTEQAYVHWAKRYILFNKKKHPNDKGEKEIFSFITNLVNA